jgi:hypothetical protein
MHMAGELMAGAGQSKLSLCTLVSGGASLKVTAVGSLQSDVFTATAITIDLEAGGNSSETILLVRQDER